MASRDLKNDIKILTALNIASISTNTTTAGDEIDTQGYELEVLEGFEKYVQEFTETLLTQIEDFNENVAETLQKAFTFYQDNLKSKKNEKVNLVFDFWFFNFGTSSEKTKISNWYCCRSNESGEFKSLLR